MRRRISCIWMFGQPKELEGENKKFVRKKGTHFTFNHALNAGI
jgi:hypothetical protein